MAERWFQIHLSTAIVLVMAAGLWVLIDSAFYLNVIAPFGRSLVTWEKVSVCIFLVLEAASLIGVADGCEWWIRRGTRR